MLRYGARPAIAQERLSYDGHVVRYQPKGAREELVFSPPVFLRRLAALIPPPRQHMTRFHGVFAPRSRFRRVVVPKESQTAKIPLSEPLPPRLRAEWAELLKRVFEVDLRVCGVCGGRRRVIATIRDPDVVQAILRHLATNAGERSRAPPGWVSDSEQEASVR